VNNEPLIRHHQRLVILAHLVGDDHARPSALLWSLGIGVLASAMSDRLVSGLLTLSLIASYIMVWLGFRAFLRPGSAVTLHLKQLTSFSITATVLMTPFVGLVAVGVFSRIWIFFALGVYVGTIGAGIAWYASRWRAKLVIRLIESMRQQNYLTEFEANELVPLVKRNDLLSLWKLYEEQCGLLARLLMASGSPR